MRWFRALHIRERYIRAMMERQSDLEERLHRLETVAREMRERMEYLEASQERLLARFKGARGGRPANPPSNPLANIPHGDKTALRAALLNGKTPHRGDDDA